MNFSMMYIFYRDDILFSNGDCECTTGQVAEAFKPTGFLCSLTAPVGTYLLRQKFKNSDKLIVPFHISVSFQYLFFLL